MDWKWAIESERRRKSKDGRRVADGCSAACALKSTSGKPQTEADDPFGVPGWAAEAGLEGGPKDISTDDILLRSAFHLSSAGVGVSPAFTAWGRVATGGFETEEDGVTMDGDVTTGLVGFDAEWERLLAGVMLSQSEGEGSYRLDLGEGDHAHRPDAGTVESSLTGVYPYARLDLNARVSAWAIAGVGSGELTLHQKHGKSMATDITLRMGAVGVKGQVLDGTGPEQNRDERQIRRDVGGNEERGHRRARPERRRRHPPAVHPRGQPGIRARQRRDVHPERRARAPPRWRRRRNRHRHRSGRRA